MFDKSRWLIQEHDAETVKLLSESLRIKPLCAKLLINRDYTDVSSARSFIEKSDAFLYDRKRGKNLEFQCQQFIPLYHRNMRDNLRTCTVRILPRARLPQRKTARHKLRKASQDDIFNVHIHYSARNIHSSRRSNPFKVFGYPASLDKNERYRRAHI